MRAFKHIVWVGFIAFAMMFSHTAQAQFAVGIQGGIGVDTDETVVGLIGRYSFGNIEVGANLEFGSWKQTFDTADFLSKRIEVEETGSVFRFNIPIAYMFSIGESGFSLFPLVQVGTASWSVDDCDACESESETTVEVGGGARYKFVFVSAVFNPLGDDEHGIQKGGPKSVFRIGGVYGF